MADDPIAGLATALSEDHKATKRQTAAEAKKREATRKTFELTVHQAESHASAEQGGPAQIEMFWRRMGKEIGFDPASVKNATPIDDGTLTFSAIPADVAELNEAIEKLGEAVIEHDDTGKEGTAPAIERLSRIAEESLPEGRALVRFATMFMLDQIKHSPRWTDLLESGQRDLAATIQQNAHDLVAKIVQAVRANGAPTIRALLESYNEKDGIKASLKIKPESEQQALEAVIGLHKAQGKFVLITVASAEDFDQSPAEIAVDPDEPGLGFDDGTDDHPDDDSDLAGDDEDDQAEA